MTNNKKTENEMQYMPIGMCLGVGIGAGIGAATDNIGLWMCVGIAIGMSLGVALDSANRKKENDGSNNTEQTEKTDK